MSERKGTGIIAAEEREVAFGNESERLGRFRMRWRPRGPLSETKVADLSKTAGAKAA